MSLLFKNLIGISIIVAMSNIVIPNGKMKRTSEIVMSIFISLIIILNISNIKFDNIKIQDIFEESYNYEQENIYINNFHYNMIENILNDNQIEYIRIVCKYKNKFSLSGVDVFLKEKNDELEIKIKELITKEYVFCDTEVNFLYE